jgi:hypothetical protein
LDAQRFEVFAQPAVDEIVGVQRRADAHEQQPEGGTKSESTEGSDPGAQGLPMITDIWSVFVKSAQASHDVTTQRPNGRF